MRIVAIVLLGLALLAGGARAQQAGAGWLGLSLQPVTPDIAEAIGMREPKGALIAQALEGGPAALAGVKAGDVILSIDGEPVNEARDVPEKISRLLAGNAVRLTVLRNGLQQGFVVRLGAWPEQFTAPKPAANAPLPMLDTGGHMAKISGIAFTPDGRQLVSASDDKTIRVWDLASGKTVRTIRGESALGDSGKVYAIALSPDGKWLVAGGWMDQSAASVPCCGDIRLYEIASGKLVALLQGHRSVVNSLAFSRDSKKLISGSGLGDRSAIIWDVERRVVLHRLEGHTAQIYAVGFSPDGSRAVTGSYDHDLRLWRVADGKEIARMTGHSDQVQSLAVTQDGTIASGDRSGEIRLWDVHDGRILRVLARQTTSVGSLSFSPDGKLLLSGTGRGPEGNDCHVYETTSGKEIVTYTGHDNIVLATAFSPDGRWAATGGGNNEEIHLWDPHSGKPRPGPDGKPLRLAGQGQRVRAAGFSADGRRIGWGNSLGYKGHNDRGPLEQALTLPLGESALGAPVPLSEAEADAFRRAQVRFGGFSLSHRKGGAYGDDAILDISKDGRAVASITRDSKNGFDHRSYSFAPDGETVVSGGSNSWLTAYDRAGNKLGDFVGHEGDVVAVAPSPDGRFLVSGSSDQTVRLWNLKTRELLVTLFRGVDGEWVMWTPQGFYTATAAGARLIGWQINRGPEHAAEFVTAAQLRQHLNRPDIVARAIQLASAKAAVNEARGADFKIADLLTRPVPRLRIVSPEADASMSGGHAQVTVELEATPDPVKLIRIHVNGRLIASKPSEKDGFKPGRLAFDVPLAGGADTIAVAAENSTGETVASLSLTHKGEGDLDRPGTLYILAIGVDKYPNLPGHDLRYAGADAKAFAEAMEKRASPLHRRVIKRLLADGGTAADAPTAANILDAFNMLRQTRENDTVMLFVSGHGVNEGPDYQFAPADAAWGGETLLRQSSVVPWHAFAEALTGANGRRIVFIDTCHAGNAFNRRFLSDGYEANITFYSSAGPDQDAQENSALGGGHGLFTYALVEGVNGAARDGAGEVHADGLHDFLKSRVGVLAAKLSAAQEPQYFRARDAENYVLARPE